ncbi:synaptosomal-associated protein 23-like [Halichondria panicea]|uniref:synaptosomal-associated protein 23-like n=1 Tax=Halichondria panicea TaxID=6063 RepID=UPI00312B9F98
MATRELAAIEHDIDVTTDKSVAATRNILNTAIDTKQLGIKTVTKLVKQGEQLENIANTVEIIGVDIKHSRQEASKLDLCGCWCRCCCQGLNVSSKPVRTARSRPSETVVNRQPVAFKNDPQDPIIKFVLDNDDREVEIDQNLRETGKILDDLSELAIGIGDELDRQNEYIPELTEQATKTSNDIEAATAHLKKCTPV